MFRSIIVLAVTLVPAFAWAQAPAMTKAVQATGRAAAGSGIDLMLGADDLLPVEVLAVPVVFRDRAGAVTEVHQTGRVALRPGTYTVHVGNQSANCRVWAHGTAPPAAHGALPIVRGQNPGDWLWNLDRYAPQAMILSGIGLVIWGAASAS